MKTEQQVRDRISSIEQDIVFIREQKTKALQDAKPESMFVIQVHYDNLIKEKKANIEALSWVINE